MAEQPLYRQIAEDLRKQIDDGTLAPGSQLPTEIELREKYDASRNTIRDAVRRLSSQGLIETKPGRGTFVTTRPDPFVFVLTARPDQLSVGEGATYLSTVGDEDREASISTPKVGVQSAPKVIAARLRVAPGTQVVSRHQERFIDDFPWSLQTSFYPLEFVTRGATQLLMAEDIEEGAVRYLGAKLGLSQIGYRDWITARTCDSNEQAFFRIPHDSTVFEIFRTAFDETGTPLRVTVTVFPTDRNQFIINVGEVPEPEYSQDDPQGQAHEPA
jgi:GntR family transcriptional regulator